MKKLLLGILIVGAAQSQCNESNWQEYYNSDGWNMEYCDLAYANLSGASLLNAWLWGTNLTGATLAGANLSGSTLTWANLAWANFSGADLSAADLSGADLLGANLDEACLEGAVGFTQTNFFGSPIVEGCAENGECLFEDLNEDDYDDASYTEGFIAGYSEGVVMGIESVDITADNEEAYNLGFSEGQASVDTNNDGRVDEFPIISISGQAVLQLEETENENYVDDGATCQDVQDGAISQNVEVSGDVVNMSIPGTYTLHYNCSDSDGNEAQTANRTVVVLEECLFSDADTNNDGLIDEFPVISIVDGNAMVLIEGSLNEYTDSGATCFDQEDGHLSHQVEVSGQVVNVNNAGTYIVFYNCSDSDGNAAQTKHRTVFIVDQYLFSDEDEDGYDDDSYVAGAQSGDVNGDGALNVVDIVMSIDMIINGE